MNGVPLTGMVSTEKREHHSLSVLSHLSKQNILTLKQQLEIRSFSPFVPGVVLILPLCGFYLGLHSFVSPHISTKGCGK